MKVLGIHGGPHFLEDSNPLATAYHDAAAVLLEDGRIIAAVEEERITRMKHCNSFPLNAIRYCLESTNTVWHEVDRVAINHSFAGSEIADTIAFLENPHRSLPPGAQNHLAGLFERAFGVDLRGRFRFCHHHLAHAWSAFVPSGFERALVVSLDGEGDNASGMILTAKDLSLRKLREYSIEQSLGNLYTSFIRLLGYSRFDEYKVMGLAPYGNPEFLAANFASCYHLLPEGNYALEPLPRWLRVCEEIGAIKSARRKGEPFSQLHKDLAATIQHILEEIVLHVLQDYQAMTGERNLCLAGGVAHNCTMNGKVLRSGLFENVFVQPAAHDAGGAIGAALWAYYAEQSCPRRECMSHLYYGPDIGSDEEIAAGLERWSGFVHFKKSANIAAECAALLADDAVISWVQGRSEFGPRALGNRSILADPRPVRNKARINEMVKKREGYRPFAPSVLEEKLRLFFDLPPTCDALPFMIFVVPVREEHQKAIGAITHVDGTARVHSVSRKENPRYWELIREFDRLTGTGMVLNTSFNNNAEPIVQSVDDAVVSFLTTGLSYLAIGSYIVSRRTKMEQSRALLQLRPELPVWRKLVKRRHPATFGRPAETVFQIESIKAKEFALPVVRISREIFCLLQYADGDSSMTEVLRQSGLNETAIQDRLLEEISELWARRLIILAPQSRRQSQLSQEEQEAEYVDN
jgi:carbamoyltransferase